MTAEPGGGGDASAEHHGTAPQVAWSDLDALVGFYGCTAAEMRHGLDAARPGNPFPELVRSWVHEHQHLYHSITTPFGLFVWRLRALQTAIVHDLLVALPEELGLPVKQPLLKYVESLPAAARDVLQPAIQLWYAAEVFLTQELGSLPGWMGPVQSPTGAGLSPDLVFRTLQAGIARQYAALQRGAESAGEPIRSSTRVLPSALEDEPLLEPDDWRALHRTFTLMRLVVDADATLPTVLESAAFAAELWGRGADEVDRLVRRRDLGSGAFSYVLPVARTAQATGTGDVRRLVLTHLAVCDLAMCPPVLPQHRGLRRNGLAWRELLPELRHSEILGVLNQVEPMRDPQDYARFTQEVCDALGWVSPARIAEATTLLRPAVPDLRDTLYETAMQYRRVAPWLFVWPDAWVGGPAELREFYEAFEFPIIQFTDKVLYCSDKQQLAGFENSYLLYMWHRRIMTGRPRRLRIPWRSYPEEVATLRDQLRHLMRHSLGREVPAPDLALE